VTSLQKVIFHPDTHRPYEDKRAVALVEQVEDAWRPDTRVILGDYADCLAVSFHEKNLARRHDLKWELEETNKGLDRLDAIERRRKRARIKKVYLMGNHEDRLQRYVSSKCPELFGIMKLGDMLRLRERGYEVVPYRTTYRLGKLNLAHDFGRAGRQAHMQAIQDTLGNAVIGHTHHLGIEYAGSATGESHVGACFGWLGDVEQIDYMHEMSARRNWHLGFGIGHMESNGTIHLQAIPIIKAHGKYRCVVDGRLYEA
jgi:hypothetical protein